MTSATSWKPVDVDVETAASAALVVVVAGVSVEAMGDADTSDEAAKAMRRLILASMMGGKSVAREKKADELSRC